SGREAHDWQAHLRAALPHVLAQPVLLDPRPDRAAGIRSDGSILVDSVAQRRPYLRAGSQGAPLVLMTRFRAGLPFVASRPHRRSPHGQAPARARRRWGALAACSTLLVCCSWPAAPASAQAPPPVAEVVIEQEGQPVDDPVITGLVETTVGEPFSMR